MPSGLQTFDASGILLFDLSKHTTRLVDSFNFSTRTGAFTVPIDPFGGTLFFYITIRSTDLAIRLDGSTIYWEIAPASWAAIPSFYQAGLVHYGYAGVS